jgi:hypothetical protein
MEDQGNRSNEVFSPFANEQEEEFGNSEDDPGFDKSNLGLQNHKRSVPTNNSSDLNHSQRKDGFQALGAEEDDPVSSRPRSSSHQSAGTKTSRGFLPSIVSPSVLVSVMVRRISNHRNIFCYHLPANTLFAALVGGGAATAPTSGSGHPPRVCARW